MTRRCGFWTVGQLCVAAALLLVTASFAGGQFVPHAHQQGRTDDCALCQATNTVATVDSIAEARHAVDQPTGRVLAVVVTTPSISHARTHGPRAPPAL